MTKTQSTQCTEKNQPRRLPALALSTMEKSISQTLAEIRSKTSEPKSTEVKYNAQGFEIRQYEPLSGEAERLHYPDDSYEKMQDRFIQEDTFDPS